MKTFKHLFTVLLLLCSSVIYAHDFEVDGIYYNFIDTETVEVTYKGSSYSSAAYSGDIVIPSSVTYGGNTYKVTRIGQDAFRSSAITGMTIPESIERIEFGAFNVKKSKFKNLRIEDGESTLDLAYAERYGNGRYDGLFAYRNEVELETVYVGRNFSYNHSPFANNTHIKSVTIGEKVTELGRELFSGCTGITDIVIPENVVSIGNAAFKGCTGLKDIEMLPPSISVISENMFEGCTGLASITIPSNITTISSNAFKGCTGLTSIVIPATVTKIQGGLFDGCTALESLVVDAGNTVYDSRENCNAIIETATNTLLTTCKNSVIPGSIIAIGDYAFAGNNSIVDFVIHDGVKTIGNYAFSGCTKLKSIKIPESVTNIGIYTFKDCIMLANVELPSGMTYISGSMFNGCISLRYIAIPDGITRIEDYAFAGCKTLANIEFSDNVTMIGSGTFEGCQGLTNITLPANLTWIGSGAFTGCTNLAEVTSKAFIAPEATDAFDRDRNKKLNIPEGADYFEWVRYFQIPNYDYSYNSYWDGYTQYESEWFFKDGHAIVYGTGNIDGTPFEEIKSIVFEGDFSSISGCGNWTLRYVELPKNLVTIGDNAFYGSPLDFVVIPATVTSIGDNAFGGRCYSPGGDYFGETHPTLIFKSFAAPTIGELEGDVNLCIPEGANSYPTGLFGGVSYYSSQQECVLLWHDQFDPNAKSKMLLFGNTDMLNKYSEIDGTPIKDIENITLASDATGYNLISRLPNIKSVNVTNAFPVNGKLYTVEGSNAVLRDGTLVAGCAVTKIPQGVKEIADYAFYECTGLKEIEIPSTVKSIGKCVFTGSTGLTKITIPSTVSILRDSVFCGCSGLTSIEIPNSVTSIGEQAFSGCTGLTGIEIPNSVTSIGWGAFSGCTGLTGIEIPNSVTSIGGFAFKGCTGLTGIEIPNSVTSIGDYAFSGCTGLKDVVFNAGYVEDYVFDGCSNLENLTIGKDVTAMGYHSFRGCSSLTNITVDPENSVYDSRNNCNAIIETATNKLRLASKKYVIPETVTAIARGAFDYFADMNITVPAGITSIDNGAFAGVNRLYFESETPATIDGNIFGYGAVYVPSAAYETYCNADVWRDYVERIVTAEMADVCVESFSSEGVSGIFNAFDDSRLIRKVVKLKVTGCINSYDITLFRDKMLYLNELDLSEATVIASSKPFYQTYSTGDNSLGGYAFYDLDRLVSVKLPKDLKVLGNNAFKGCDRLVSVDASATAELNIGNCAFSECSNLKEFVSPAKISEIGDSAFYSCEELEKIELNDISGSIGCSAFVKCGKLVVGDFEKIGGNICKHAFYESRIKNLNIDYLGGNIRGEAFYGSLLEDVRIAAMDGNLEEDAFRKCESLKSVEFGRGPAKIGSKVFTLSNSLVSFIAGDGTLEVAENAFFASKMVYMEVLDRPEGIWVEKTCSRPVLKSVVLPSSVQKIGNSAFYECTSLSDFTMPQSITSIGESAFYDCDSLKSLKMSQSVTSIGESAFSNCNSLQSVNLSAGLTEIPNSAFSGCCSLKDVTFPEKLTTIGENAFSGCAIDDLRLPPRLKTISVSAFNGCSSLTELHIPSSVEYIGSYAFSGCYNLKSVYTYTVEPTTITETTFSTYGTATLYIPETSFQYYYWDIGWSRFNEDRFQKFNEVYNYFYLNNDYVLNESTGYIEGTPDADMRPGSGLIVSGDENNEDVKQNLGEVSLETDGEGNSASIIGDNSLYIENLNVKINIKGGRWYFFAFPWDVELDRVSMQNGSDYVFRYYDGEERAKNGNGGWKNVNEPHLKAARGYIFQSSGDDVLVISIEDVKFKKEDKYNELVTHASENLNDASWNLMGNPYLSYYDLAEMEYTAPVTVWDGEKYVAIRPGDDDYQFTPYEAFFVQKPEGEESVTFAADGQMTKTQAETEMQQKAAARRVRGIDPQRLLVNLVLGNDVTEDRTRVVFNERQTHNYETACDAAKFMTAGLPQLYTIDNEGIRYAINERPKGNGVVLMGYTAPVPGYYTIDAPRMDAQVFLYDAETGEIHYFEDGAYSFSSEAGTFEKRFSLGIRDDEATGIEEVKGENGEVNSENGKVKTIYDLHGRKLNRTDRGIYIINGKKVLK